MKLTESKLKEIVNRSIKQVLKEEQEMGSTIQELNQARNILKGIRDSKFIPFTSPAPSSTEQKVKESILTAIDEIGYAIHLCAQLGY